MLTECILFLKSSTSIEGSLESTEVTTYATNLNSFGWNLVPVFDTRPINITAAVWGVVSNAFAILVILRYKKMRQRVGIWLIVNQCIFDLLASFMMGAAHVRNSFAQTMFEVPYLGVAGDLYCKLWANGFWHWGLMYASTYNLVGITLERYLMVVHPIYHKNHMTRNRVVKMCIIPCLIALVYQMAWAFFSSGLKGEKCLLYAIWPSSHWFLASSICDIAFAFAIPVGAMCSMYIIMVVALNSRVKSKPVAHGTATQSGHNLSKAQRNMTKTCVIIVVAYICLWTPTQVVWTIFAFEIPISSPRLISRSFLVLVNLNLCINPFIYIFTYDEFRRGISNLFGFKITSSIDSSTGQKPGTQRTGGHTARF